MLLAAALVLTGCPDSAGDGSGTPTEDTKVKGTPSTALSANSVTLNWDLPTDSAGYLGATISEESNAGNLSNPVEVAAAVTTYMVTNLEPATEYVFTIATRYTDSGKNNSITIPVSTLRVPTQATKVQSAAIGAITRDAIILNWAAPTDTVGFLGVTISEKSKSGSLMNAVELDAETTTYTVTGLSAGTEYTFTIATRYIASGKNNDTTITATTVPAIDADDDKLIDITSVERLYNVRYNLDLMDGRYKTNADDVGVQCGTAEDVDCTGYELIRNLDFTDAGSYDSGEVNTDWRPNNSDPAMATNAGWEPIGSCNANTDSTNGACGDNDDTPFAIRFQGNGYSISNLYARNTNNSTGTAIGLFGIVGGDATIDTVGIVDAFVYGSRALHDFIGGLVGFNRGAITASHASGSTADGGMGNDIVGGLVGFNRGAITVSHASSSRADGGMGTDSVGGLVGFNRGAITASYASSGTADGGMGGDAVGGLVGRSNSSTIIASYATGTANGGADNDNVGGLVGRSSSSSSITASYATGTANGGADNDNVGGLVGENFLNGTITASYATATADGGMGSSNTVGSLVAINSATSNVFDPPITISGTITASYGFGNTVSVGTAGESGSADLPSGVTAAAHLTAPSTAVATAVAAEWDQASSVTTGVWHFGGTTDIPALRYADYDGAGDTYGCGSDSMATAVIPSSVPNGTGGTITVNCGTTLLPGQGR